MIIWQKKLKSMQVPLTELDDPPPNFAVHGRDLMNGIPKEVIVTYKEIANALNNSIEAIERAIMNALFTTPPTFRHL